MTLLFRSKSFRLGGNSATSLPTHSLWEEETEDEEEEEEEDEEFKPISSSLGFNNGGGSGEGRGNGGGQPPIVAFVVAALRKSLLVTSCSSVVREEDVSSSSSSSALEIGCPTDVRHISHVTFDRFNGFLGLPLELEPELPIRVPSASASVFGVSPQSMQCSIDERGNSVPTILLMMQKRLYMEGGLEAEGIFRINAENSQEKYVRNQLNKGVVPQGIDVHCMAGLIKAWFRELPKGVLDTLTPEQVMHCNTEDQCTQLVKLLPPTEYALLDWAINLMADVVQNEHHNKMNARNIAMVFAPNMTLMADPLTALIHAVQVMNFLKTLIVRTLRLREESEANSSGLSSPHTSISLRHLIFDKQQDTNLHEQPNNNNKLLRSVTLDRLEFSPEQKNKKSLKKYEDEGNPYASISGGSSPVTSMAIYAGGEEGILDRLSFRKGVKKLYRHPVFQLSKPAKKTCK